MHTPHREPGSPGSEGPEDAGSPEELSEDMLAADPVEQFSRWLGDAVAAGLPQPNAMVLATTSAEGHSRARTVLLKAHDADGFVFYTNRTSRKGRDLAVNPWACLVFPWYAIGRQVTVEGAVTAMSKEQSEPYFTSRPRGSRIGAWVSRQSQVIGSRAELEARYAKLDQRWPPGTDVPMPDFWGGYRVVPETIEFWRSRENRLHDRLRYTRAGGDGWVIQRLAP